VSSAAQEIVFDKHLGTLQSWRVGGRETLLGGPVVNLGEAKAGGERGYYQAAQPPVTDGASFTAQPQPDGSVRVSVTSRVLAKNGGAELGGLSCTYDIKPTAEIGVAWNLKWTAPDTDLWEAGLKLTAPAGDSQMAWSRDSFFTAYPVGHVGEPAGTCQVGDTLFRSSKRGLHWMTLTDTGGAGLALLAADAPLVARADRGALGTTLFASREVAGPRGLSGSWVADHAIRAARGKPLSGAFLLRAVGQ